MEKSLLSRTPPVQLRRDPASGFVRINRVAFVPAVMDVEILEWVGLDITARLQPIDGVLRCTHLSLKRSGNEPQEVSYENLRAFPITQIANPALRAVRAFAFDDDDADRSFQDDADIDFESRLVFEMAPTPSWNSRNAQRESHSKSPFEPSESALVAAHFTAHQIAGLSTNEGVQRGLGVGRSKATQLIAVARLDETLVKEMVRVPENSEVHRWLDERVPTGWF